MLKKTFFQIHWFMGITAGLILSIMGVTGAIYSYEQQILKWINTDSYVVHAENRDKLSPAELYTHFQQVDPNIQINSITLAKDPTASSTINIVKEGARKGYNMMVNPYSAEVLPEIKGQGFFQFVQQLHRNLTVGPVGKQITAACTLMLIFFVLSGLYLRWPKRHSFKQWFMLKPQLKGRNFLWDLHAVVGTWVVVFYLLMACTGLYWSYDWWRNGMFKVMGVERPQPEMQGGKPEGQSSRPASGEHRTEHTPQGGPAEDARTGQGRGQFATNAGHPETRQTWAASKSESGRREPADGESRGAQQKAANFSPEQMQSVLTQTWTGGQAKLGHDYSTLTLNLPKKADGKVELSFVDPIPQHERARNKAVYDYQAAKVQDVELYEDKKLNEKIMSSMLPVHRGSFFGPIYQFFAMLAALAMPLFFVTGWMLYLKRRKQKKLTQAARASLNSVTIDPHAKPWLIVYASQTGVAEQLAWRTATSLQEARQPVSVKTIQQLTSEELKTAQQVLFVASTYGTGDAPDLATSFAKTMLKSTLDLSQLQFAVLALGSKEYPESYCSFGHAIAAWLKHNHAQAMFDTIEVDNANPHDIQRWNAALAKVSKLELQAMQIDKTFDSWTLIQRELLNPNSLGAPAFNLELQAKHEAHWQAGDIAEVQPGNSPARIQAFMEKHHIAAQTQVESLAIPIEQALWNKQLNTAVEPFANMEHLLEQLETLPAREYSIASIPSQQKIRLVIRQQQGAQGELGLGSGWLTAHAKIGQEIALRIRNNESFHLIDDNRPIICIGNGTGIAGLMSLLHARVRADYTQNWLIFGERQREHDYFYQSTIEAWQTTGMLERLDLAFSRDQAEKVYVHHVLRNQAAELVAWINRGAVIYVCGSIQGMARDVDQALMDILGENTVEQLRLDGRYRRDVY